MGVRFVVVAAILAGGAVGCGNADAGAEVAPALETSAHNLVANNGREINGREINGREINGAQLGSKLVAVRYAGARREGMSLPLSTVWLEGSTFHGLSGTQELSGKDFLQMRFTGVLQDGTNLTLRVDDMTQGSGSEQDVWSYRVSYQNTADGQWYPICTNADGSAAGAIPLENRWDYREGVSGGGSKIYDTTSFTFACEGAALAKCVHFGYKPWSSVNGVSLEEHHQACTRMVRADYCGNGTSYTANGNLINIYDSLGVQSDTELWVPEAEWTSDGASCFGSQTRATTPIQCGEKLVTTCAMSFSPKTLLITETPTR